MQSKIQNSIASYFWANACDHPTATALWICGDDGQVARLTWGQLGESTASLILHVQQRGLEAGAHMASCLTNSLLWIQLDIAAQTLGLVHVAIDPRETWLQRRVLTDFSESQMVFDEAHSNSGDWDETSNYENSAPSGDTLRCRQMASRVHTDSAAHMLFTSGSLDEPKGVLLSHRNLVSNARAKLAAAPQSSEDLRLNILPFCHAYARTCELSTWIITRGQMALASSWPNFVQLARRLQPTLLNLVPYQAELLANELDLNPLGLGGRLRLLQVGGASLSDSLWQRLNLHGLPPLQGYGLTECSPVVCSNRAGAQQPGVVGPAIEGVELRIDDSQVLWCRGPNVMLGYWKNAALTQSTIRDGWLCTGDLAEQDSSGTIRIVGRVTHQLILSTGYKVSPEPIERELEADDWIERAILFGTGQPFVVALIWPTQRANQRGGSSLRVELAGKIDSRLRQLPRHAIPSRVAIMQDPLTVEAGTLTRKGTPRRQQLLARYGLQIAELFQRP